MAAIKLWARSIFVLSVLTSTALVLVPKSMQKQARFVTEMLILLCIVAPLASLMRNVGLQSDIAQYQWDELNQPQTLETFLALETERRVLQITNDAGIPVLDVEALASKGGFTLAQVKIWSKDRVPEGAKESFVATLSAYLGVPKDKITVIQPE